MELLEKEAEERAKAVPTTTEETIAGDSSAEVKPILISANKQAASCPFSAFAKPGEAPPHAIASTAEPCCG